MRTEQVEPRCCAQCVAVGNERLERITQCLFVAAPRVERDAHGMRLVRHRRQQCIPRTAQLCIAAEIGCCKQPCQAQRRCIALLRIGLRRMYVSKALELEHTRGVAPPPKQREHAAEVRARHGAHVQLRKGKQFTC